MTDEPHERAVRALAASPRRRRRTRLVRRGAVASAAGCSRISSSRAAPGGSGAGSGSDTAPRPRRARGRPRGCRRGRRRRRGRPRSIRPTSSRPTTRAGHRRRRGERVRERDAERVKVPNRLAPSSARCPRARPSELARAAVSHLDLDVAEAIACRRPAPAPAIASVTSATRPRQRARRAARSRRRRGARRGSAGRRRRRATSAAPAMPGSRWLKGRIALKRCVTARAPRSNAASASSAVASVWPQETGDAAREQQVDRARARRGARARA